MAKGEMSFQQGVARHVPEGASEGVETLARAGYLAKGAVYIVLGALALQAAVAGGGRVEGGKGAVYTIAEQPFGSVLLVFLAIGLAGYSVWRAVQSVLDVENKGNDAKGLAKRVGYAASGLSHAFLCVVAVQLLSGGGGGGQNRQSFIADIMSSGFGQFIVGAVGVFVVGVGLHQLHKAKTAEFRQELKIGEMSPAMQRVAIVSGRIGLAARGIVFPIIGIYLVKAAVAADPSEVKGVGGALREISSSPFGTVMLAIVAAGLIAYGGYQLVVARYRKIPSAV